MNQLPFEPVNYSPEKRISREELCKMAADFRMSEERKIKRKLEILKPHMATIKKFESTWDDVTLSRFKANGLNDEIKWAWWDLVCTNRKLLNTIKA